MNAASRSVFLFFFFTDLVENVVAVVVVPVERVLLALGNHLVLLRPHGLNLLNQAANQVNI